MLYWAIIICASPEFLRVHSGLIKNVSKSIIIPLYRSPLPHGLNSLFMSSSSFLCQLFVKQFQAIDQLLEQLSKFCIIFPPREIQDIVFRHLFHDPFRPGTILPTSVQCNWTKHFPPGFLLQLTRRADFVLQSVAFDRIF